MQQQSKGERDHSYNFSMPENEQISMPETAQNQGALCQNSSTHKTILKVPDQNGLSQA